MTHIKTKQKEKKKSSIWTAVTKINFPSNDRHKMHVSKHKEIPDLMIKPPLNEQRINISRINSDCLIPFALWNLCTKIRYKVRSILKYLIHKPTSMKTMTTFHTFIRTFLLICLVQTEEVVENSGKDFNLFYLFWHCLWINMQLVYGAYAYGRYLCSSFHTVHTAHFSSLKAYV